jgi:N-acetylglucosamine kinase-like BadF-type ATPase
MSDLFLGVDGGQSSTTALIGDAGGRVIGVGRGGACNHTGTEGGRARFVAAIEGCLKAACAAAGLDAGSVRFASACLGFSGGPADKRKILESLLRASRMMVTDDALIALTGALAGEPGIIAIAGTGSMTFGRNAAGETARAGGWGYVFGDEGGAFDIVRRALRSALRMEEGWGPETALRWKLMEAADAPDANTLLHRFYTDEFSRAAMARFAPLVDEAAEAGDDEARLALSGAAKSLAWFTLGVRQRLFGELGARVAPIGGAFRSRRLRDEFRAAIEAEGNRLTAAVHGPAAGALIEAYRAAGLAVELSNVPVEKE